MPRKDMSNTVINSPLSVASSTPLSLQPISTSNRIDAMDILRGLALVGILLMNIEWFGRSMLSLGSFDTNLTGLDHTAGWLVRCFVEGKFYKIFALLFGMGFAVMLISAKEANRPYGSFFLRRMVVLYVFGLLHMAFLWGGDILHDYAFAGLVLLAWIFFLKRSDSQLFDKPRSLLKVGLIWLIIPALISVLAGFGFGLTFDRESLSEMWQQEQHITMLVDEKIMQVNSENFEELELAPTLELTEKNDNLVQQEQSLENAEQVLIQQEVDDLVASRLEFETEEAQEILALSEGSYWQATEFRIGFASFMLMLSPVFAFTMYLPLFILGYWFILSGVLKNHQQHQTLFKSMAWIGLGLGFPLTIGGLLITQHPATENIMLLFTTGSTLFFIGEYVLSAGYIGLVISLLGSENWARYLNKFAPLGRMALTNYITHSVILTSIFYGYAGGLYGQISRAPQMLIVLVMIVIQLYFSTWWLKRFQFGPLEWLWRSLTYKKMQPMRVI